MLQLAIFKLSSQRRNVVLSLFIYYTMYFYQVKTLKSLRKLAFPCNSIGMRFPHKGVCLFVPILTPIFSNHHKSCWSLVTSYVFQSLKRRFDTKTLYIERSP